MPLRLQLLCCILAACAGPSAHRCASSTSALAPATVEGVRPPVASSLDGDDPLAAAHCEVPTLPQVACPQEPQPHHHHHESALVVDPVCKMKIDPKTAAGGSVVSEGQQYWFCSQSCRRSFLAQHPEATP